MRSILSAFIAVGALQALTVTAQDPACLANCSSQVRAEFTGFGCTAADEAGCLCTKSDFKSGVKDCAAACGSNEGDVDSFLNEGFCLGQAPPAAEEPSSAPAPEASATDGQPPEATSAAPESSAAEEPTSIVADQQPTETPAPETTEEVAPESTTEVLPAETTAAVETTSAAAETEPSTTFSTKTSAAAGAGQTSGADQDEKDEDGKDDDDKDEGLSQAAVIGIGVGVGAAGLAAIGVLIWFLLRKRTKKDSRPFIEISKPMPADGAGDYTGRRDPFAEKRGDVFEMRTNRYEDMMPRQEPRTAV